MIRSLGVQNRTVRESPLPSDFFWGLEFNEILLEDVLLVLVLLVLQLGIGKVRHRLLPNHPVKLPCPSCKEKNVFF